MAAVHSRALILYLAWHHLHYDWSDTSVLTSHPIHYDSLINPEVVYAEPVKAMYHQDQSLSIIVSISDVSLRLRPYTPTLISASHRHIVIIPMGFRRVYPERSCFPYRRWNMTSYRTCISIQYLYIWELCRCALTTHTSAILAYSALPMSGLDNTTARDI